MLVPKSELLVHYINFNSAAEVTVLQLVIFLYSCPLT